MLRNSASLSRLLIKERQSLIRFAQRIVGSATAAEDVTQNLWLRIQRVEDYPPIINKRAYLFRLVSHLSIDHLRALQRHDKLFQSGEVHPELGDGQPDAERQLLDKEQLVRLGEAVEQLPLRCRQVFQLIKVDELTISATATRLGISQDMVRKHIRHALKHCHQYLRDSEE
ncbi:RNA polymerase sigma factor [Sphingopyxis yananensis]|jgi:RNA polymerase sigma factor (sigma-70 family)|uniref:RNA polymerase sigma factor n=1 Tax=Sphingopyxis yananensis TaxID=2886687 RepID=UPI001D127873|nr:RNA polymerase sigma factor [Sphingopyxis yananensis]MCC2603164.1 RNA polymerase sigma factor [Sphingopyxis yananensis]